MKFIKWVCAPTVAMLLIPLVISAQSQDTNDRTTYILVTLDELSVEQTSPSAQAIELRLMLGAVAASGGRVQKTTWPSAIWTDSSPGLTHFEGEASGVPLFALPEVNMGDEFGFTLVALDNQIPNEDLPEAWLSTSFPSALEAASNPLALWVTGQDRSPDQVAERVEAVIAPFQDENDLLGVFAVKLTRADDWGVREAPYRATIDRGFVDLHLTYRVQRVTVPTDLATTVRIKRIALDVAGSSRDESLPVVIHSQSAAGFAGESFNGLSRRLPFVDAYEFLPGSSQPLDEVLYDGPVGPFLYVGLGIWTQEPSVQALGSASLIWTAEQLLSESMRMTIPVDREGERVQVVLSVALQRRR